MTMRNPDQRALARAPSARARFAAALLSLRRGPRRTAGPFLDGIHRQTTLTTTVPDNGDQNPYAIVVAPVSAGVVQKDDVLVTNFNNDGNLQGLGTTIVSFTPTTKTLTTFASLPRNLAGCPGGVGLTTAMTMLKSGWVIVGSAPSADGTTGTKGPGCLIVLDANGKVASVIANDGINMPWGNMAILDEGDSATIFVSNTGFGVGSPDGDPRVVNEQTVVRLKLVHQGRPAAAGREPDRRRQRLRGAAEQGRLRRRAHGPRARARRDALRLGCDRQPHQRDLGRAHPRSQRGRRPDCHQGRPLANAASAGDRAERPSSGDQRQEWSGRGNRSRRAASRSRLAGSIRTRRRSRLAAAICSASR